jgi:hypothetical protein
MRQEEIKMQKAKYLPARRRVKCKSGDSVQQKLKMALPDVSLKLSQKTCEWLTANS